MKTRIWIAVAICLSLCACTEASPPEISGKPTVIVPATPTNGSWQPPSQGTANVSLDKGPTPTTAISNPSITTTLAPEKDFFKKGDAVYVSLTMDNPSPDPVMFTATVIVDGKQGQTITGMVEGKSTEPFSIAPDIPSSSIGDFRVTIVISDGDTVFLPESPWTVVRIR